MRKPTLCLPVILGLLLMGCAGGINTSALKRGMSAQELVGTLGNPECTYTETLQGNRVDVWDFAKDTTGVANPLDDYGWIPFCYPTTHIVRVWMINGKVEEWQSGKFGSLESLNELTSHPKWKIPGDLKGGGAPFCIPRDWMKESAGRQVQ